MSDTNVKSRRFFFKTMALVGATALSTKTSAEEPKINDGKAVVVIGGTSGMGRNAVEFFAKKNYKVYFCGRRENLGNQIVNSLQSVNKNVFYSKIDIRLTEEVHAFFSKIKSSEKTIDFFFNNAGVPQTPESSKNLSRLTIEDQFATNFYGIFSCLKEELFFSNQKNGCVIVNNISMSAHRVKPDQAAYAASKAALLALSKSMALDLVKDKIYIYTISPYNVRTELLEKRAKFLNINIESFTSRMPIKRMIEPEEVSSFLYQLVQAPPVLMIGHDFVVSGGYNEFMV